LSKYDGCAPDEKADQGNKAKLNQKASVLQLQASYNFAINSSLRGSLFDEMSAQPLTGTAEHSIPFQLGTFLLLVSHWFLTRRRTPWV
jgi:hypothetical protein